MDNQIALDAAVVLTDVHDGVLTITINRPYVRNAVNGEVARLIAKALDRLDDDSDLRAGIITGAGGNFCSGMDLKAFLRGERPVAAGRGFAGLSETPPQKPLIAAVEGYALAGGFEVALTCDLIVAGRSASFGLPEVARGLIAGGGGLLRLGGRVPENIATELSLTAAPLGAERAHSLGLVNHLTEDGGALEGAHALARRIAQHSPAAVVASKTILRDRRGWAPHEEFSRQAPFVWAIIDSDDAREGAAAFAEKRAPVWVSR